MLLGREKLKKIPWTQLIIESVLVVLSVLGALAVNNWNREKLNEETAHQAMINIREEIESNKEKVIEAIKYNTELVEKFKADPYAGGSLKPAFIRNSAWQTTLASGAISYLDFKLISMLSEINEYQEDYKDIIDIGTQALYIGNLGLAEEKTHNFHPMINTVYDFMYREKRLYTAYEKALKLIDSIKDK